MKNVVRFFTFSLAFMFLLSCESQQTLPVDQLEDEKADAIQHSLFDAWNDSSLSNIAVANLIKQADKMIDYKQMDEAQGKLERSLRVSARYAPAWSRLSWLALRKSKLKKSVQLAYRSNSYTVSDSLKILNWTFIRDAYRLMGDTVQVNQAKDTLLRLRQN